MGLVVEDVDERGPTIVDDNENDDDGDGDGDGDDDNIDGEATKADDGACSSSSAAMAATTRIWRSCVSIMR